MVDRVKWWPRTLLPVHEGQLLSMVLAPSDASMSTGLSGSMFPANPVFAKRGDASSSLALGFDSTGKRTWIERPNLYRGVGVCGAAKSGKTNAMLWLWRQTAGLCESGGNKDTPLWIELKGKGASEALEACDVEGVNPVVIDALSKTPPIRLDLFRGYKSRLDAATQFRGAMKFAWEQGAISGDNQTTIQAALHLALEAPSSAYGVLGLRSRNVMDFAHALVLGRGRAVYMDLYDAMDAHHSSNKGSEGFKEAFTSWISRHELIVKNRNTNPHNSSENKFSVLRRFKGLFTPQKDERLVSVHQLVDLGHPTIVNLTSVPTDLNSDVVMDEADTEAQRYIKRIVFYLIGQCLLTSPSFIGSFSRGRSTTLFVDELSLIASSGGQDTQKVDQLFSSFKEAGRDVGFRLIAATQFLDQLPELTKESFVGFGTFVWMNQENSVRAKEAADYVDVDATADRRRYPASLFMNLMVDEDKGYSVSLVAAEKGTRRHAAFTCRWLPWDRDSVDKHALET